MGDKRTYRKFTAEQKLEIVLAGLRSGNVAGVSIAPDFLGAYCSWRDQVLEAGRSTLAGKTERGTEAELRKQIGRLERGARQEDLRAGDRGKLLAGVGVSHRVAYSRGMVAKGHPVATVARTMQISRQALRA